MLRSILAVATGVVVWGVLWVSANMGLASAMPSAFDESGLTRAPAILALFIAISSALSVLAGFLCASIASHSHMKHVATLAFVQLAIGIAVQAGVWTLMPVWYHLIFLGLVIPMHLAGGHLRLRRSDVGASTG